MTNDDDTPLRCQAMLRARALTPRRTGDPRCPYPALHIVAGAGDARLACGIHAVDETQHRAVEWQVGEIPVARLPAPALAHYIAITAARVRVREQAGLDLLTWAHAMHDHLDDCRELLAGRPWRQQPPPPRPLPWGEHSATRRARVTEQYEC